jgi:hypothetical protein
MYCNEVGRCVREKAMGERCSSHESCGVKGMCIFDTTISMYGKCTEILSQSTDTIVYPLYLTDIADTTASTYAYQKDFEKVCRSGYVNSTTGRCSTGLQSKNKGMVCTSDLDCPTTDSSIYAECKCGHNAKGLRYCDIEGGDQEWIDAFTAVRI